MEENYLLVAHVSTNIGTGCKFDGCDEFLQGENFDDCINHYLAHGFNLLHVGQETERSMADGEIYHHSVAVLGLPNSE